MRNFSLKTKENYHRNSRSSRIVRLLSILAGVVILLFLLHGVLGSFASVITRPLYVVRAYVRESSAALPVYIRGRNELLSEMNALKEQLAALSGSNATIQRLQGENEELRSLLSIHDTDRIGAGVLAQPPFVPYDVLYIDRGRSDGVVENAIVYHVDDHAVGYVSAVYDKSALVTLFSSPGMEATVYVYGPNIYTTAYGEGGGVIRISVPQGITIESGNTVVLPSLEGGVLGTISEIVSIPTQPEQHGYVTYPAPIQSIHRVGVSSRVAAEIPFDVAEHNVDSLRERLFTVDVPPDYASQNATSTIDSVSTTTPPVSGATTTTE